jgi:hypothetical protein
MYCRISSTEDGTYKPPSRGRLVRIASLKETSFAVALVDLNCIIIPYS